MSKFLYFLRININNNPSVILDQKIIDVLNENNFKEFNGLPKITYGKAPELYSDYLKNISKISTKECCTVGQLEIFLFIFGNNLKESHNH